MIRIISICVIVIGIIVYFIGYTEYTKGVRIYAGHGESNEVIELVNSHRTSKDLIAEGDSYKTYGAALFIIGALSLIVSTIQSKKKPEAIKKSKK